MAFFFVVCPSDFCSGILRKEYIDRGGYYALQIPGFIRGGN